MIIRKIDVFQFEIDGEIIAATKKAKIVGDMIYLDDMFKNEVVIKIPFGGLQINGKIPANLNAAVIMLNRFVGSFSSGSGGSIGNGGGNVISVNGKDGEVVLTGNDILLYSEGGASVTDELFWLQSDVNNNINYLWECMPPNLSYIPTLLGRKIDGNGNPLYVINRVEVYNDFQAKSKIGDIFGQQGFMGSQFDINNPPPQGSIILNLTEANDELLQDGMVFGRKGYIGIDPTLSYNDAFGSWDGYNFHDTHFIKINARKLGNGSNAWFAEILPFGDDPFIGNGAPNSTYNYGIGMYEELVVNGERVGIVEAWFNNCKKIFYSALNESGDWFDFGCYFKITDVNDDGLATAAEMVEIENLNLNDLFSDNVHAALDAQSSLSPHSNIRFEIITAYAVGDEPVVGRLYYVPDGDPLIQQSELQRTLKPLQEILESSQLPANGATIAWNETTGKAEWSPAIQNAIEDLDNNYSNLIAQIEQNTQNIEALGLLIPSAYLKDCSDVISIDSNVRFSAQYFWATESPTQKHDWVSILCKNINPFATVMTPDLGFGATDDDVIWTKDINGNDVQIIITKEDGNTPCKITIPASTKADFRYWVAKEESSFGNSYIETTTGFYRLIKSDYNLLLNNGGNNTVINFANVATSKSGVISIVLRNDLTNNVTSIGNHFIYKYTSLTFIDLSSLSNVTSIGNNFLQETHLTSIDLSSFSNVTTIGNYFLYLITPLKSIILNLPSVIKIGDYFLRGASIKSIDLSLLSNVTSIGDNFLFLCNYLESVDFGTIQDTVFAQNNNTLSVGNASQSYINGIKIYGVDVDNILLRFPNSSVNPYRNLTKGIAA